MKKIRPRSEGAGAFARVKVVAGRVLRRRARPGVRLPSRLRRWRQWAPWHRRRPLPSDLPVGTSFHEKTWRHFGWLSVLGWLAVILLLGLAWWLFLS